MRRVSYQRHPMPSTLSYNMVLFYLYSYILKPIWRLMKSWSFQFPLQIEQVTPLARTQYRRPRPGFLA